MFACHLQSDGLPPFGEIIWVHPVCHSFHTDIERTKGDIGMKLKHLWVLLIVLVPLSVFGQGTDDPGSPAVFVHQPSFQFETVVSGKSVNHDYIVQNKGTAELKITSVKTG